MRARLPERSTRIAEAIVVHPLAWGAGWALLVGALLIAGALLEWPFGVMTALLLLLIVPSAGATIIVLLATPRDHLHDRGSIFGHFFVRYVTLVAAFIAWSASVVIGAAISTAIQLEADGREDEIVETGFTIMAALLPFIAIVLWAAFIVRCAWFLARIRGWRAQPSRSDVPESLLAEHPEFRRLVIALANPGLLLVTGLVSSVGLILATEFEFVLTT